MSRTLVCVLTILAFVPVLAPQVGAQGAVGVLYLSNAASPPTSNCGAQGQGAPVNHYQMVEQVPAAGKAYTAMSGGGFSCPFQFRFTTTQDTILSGDFQVFVQLGCDVAGAAIELDYNFLAGTESVSGNQRPAVDYQCDGSSDLFTYEQTFEADDVEVPAGTVLALSLNFFAAVQGPAGAPGNWHVKIGQTERASGVYGLGLPGGGPAIVALPLNASAAASNVTSEPGGVAQFELSLLNNGTAATGFNVTAEGLPEGFNAFFDPQNGSVDAGATTTIAVEVSIPETTEAGSYPFQVRLESEGVEAQLLDLTIDVEAPAATGTSMDPTTTSANATSNATTDAAGTPASATEGEGVPGPAGWMVAAGFAVAVTFVRRRRA